METDNKFEQENPIQMEGNAHEEGKRFTLDRDEPQQETANSQSSQKKKRKKMFKNLAKAMQTRRLPSFWMAFSKAC